MKYVNLTPRWTEILPTWRRIAINNVNDSNFWEEMERMAAAADNYGDLLTFVRDSEGWTDDTIQSALAIGRGIQENERNTIKESVK